MCNGDTPPLGFNDMLAAFLPKGSADEDTKKNANQTGENTRPLGLKNTGNKTVDTVVNRTITPAIATNANKSQNGFVAGRQGVDNVVTLDTQTCIQDHIASKLRMCQLCLDTIFALNSRPLPTTSSSSF